MEIFLYMGIICGTLLFVGKLGFFALCVKKSWRKWIHRHAWAQAGLDLLLGFSAMHVLTMAGGSLVAMIGMTVFGSLSMAYIYAHLIWNKVEDKIHIPGIKKSNSAYYG